MQGKETKDSLARQITARDIFLKENDVELDSTLKDEGISGFHGKNVTKSLGLFLDRIGKDIMPGDYLAVESIDRLS